MINQPQELFLSDGKSAGVWFCPKCRIVHSQLELAKRCCNPTCQKCGDECDKYRCLCGPCGRVKNALRERDKFKKAEKIPEANWTGGVFLGDTFYSSIDDLHDYESDEDLASIHYVWAAAPERFVFLKVDRLIENIMENGFDGFDSDDIKGLTELKQAIEDFNEANRDALVYHEDRTKAIILGVEP